MMINLLMMIWRGGGYWELGGAEWWRKCSGAIVKTLCLPIEIFLRIIVLFEYQQCSPKLSSRETKTCSCSTADDLSIS